MDAERIRGEAAKIRWREWGPQAFDEAKARGKLVLLDLSAVWCHWCHVMDETSYSDPQVIEAINKDFIPVRVDIDRRPDIGERYNFGGFPTTAFLTPEGRVVSGGTYIPPEQLKETLKRVLEYFRSKADSLQQPPIRREEAREEGGGRVDESILWDVSNSLIASFDAQHGGFGSQPKFPDPESIAFALFMYATSGEQGFLRVARKTLDGIAGGLQDPVEGGFFRYSVTGDWKAPHYEKMLETNAGLIRSYLHLYESVGDAWSRGIAERALRYVSGNLYREGGGFYGSQDADEDYYRLPAEERAKRPAPRVDETVYTNWSAMMAHAMLEAYRVIDDEAYLDMALKTIDFHIDRCYDPAAGMHHFYDGQPRLQGLLSDQVYMMRCLIGACEVTGSSRYLAHALRLEDYISRSLMSEGGGYYDRTPREDDVGELRGRGTPLAENSVAAECLVKLHQFTGEGSYAARAEATLTRLSTDFRRYGPYASRYALAAALHLRPIQIITIGPRDDPRRRELTRRGLKLPEVRKTVITLDPEDDEALIKKLGHSVREEPTAYICSQGVCSPPVTDPDRIPVVVKQYAGNRPL